MSPLHTLRNTWPLSVAISAMLALGVGAGTVVFGLIDGALLRPVPFADPEHLVALYQTRAASDGTLERTGWSWPRILLLRQAASSFTAIASYSSTRVLLTGGEAAERVPGEYVSPEYFRVVGVEPAIGRGFTANNAGASDPEIVLSHDLWRGRFGADSALIGQPVRIGELVFTVIGVMPRGFHGLADDAQLWLPPAFAPQLSYTEYLTTDQTFISVVARVKPGIDAAAAGAELQSLQRTVQRQIPPEAGTPFGSAAIPLNQARIDRGTQRALGLLLVAVLLLHVIASANSLSLLLDRALAQFRVAAIRASLGASPSQLFRHYLLQWGGLALAAGLLGAAAAVWAGRLLGPATAIWRHRRVMGGVAPFADPMFDERVLAAGIGLALITAILVAVPPALLMARGQIFPRLRGSSGASTPGAGTLRRPTLRGALVALEIALAVVLVASATLLLDSYRRMRSTDFGVEADQVVTFMVMPPLVRYPDSTGARFVATVLREVAGLPGVIGATVDGGAPANGSARGQLHIVGQADPPVDQLPVVTRHYVAADHFRTLGIPLRRGRGFSEADRRDSPGIAVISQSAAQRFWPGADPIGRRIWFGPGSGYGSADSSAEIVGIVADVVDEPLMRQANPDAVYTPFLQYTPAWRYFLVRTTGDPLAIVPLVRRIVSRLEPEATVSEVHLLPDLIAGTWARTRFDALLFGGLGLLGLTLAGAGAFALVLHSVSQRMREMGIRLALGSSPGGIVRLVLTDGMVFPIAGLMIGLVGSLGLTRLLRASLYGVTPGDPGVFAVTALLLLLASVVACLIPARRASQADPMLAMRADS